MKWIKPLIGVLLITLSLGGLIFWEMQGRNAVLMEEIVVAKHDIRPGTKVDRHQFTIIDIPKENILEGALSINEIDRVQGKIASQLILKNQQISSKYFRQDSFYLSKGESIFVIDPKWISMRSSSIRRGDMVEIYGEDGRGSIGTYRIAFVKDSTEREVRDTSEEGFSRIENDLLERTDSTSMIQHIEIISTMSQYKQLLDHVTGVTPTALILVQKGSLYDK